MRTWMTVLVLAALVGLVSQEGGFLDHNDRRHSQRDHPRILEVGRGGCPAGGPGVNAEIIWKGPLKEDHRASMPAAKPLA